METEVNHELIKAPLIKSIVLIQDKKGQIVGLGFIVGKNQILTCAHVIKDALGEKEIPDTPPQGEIKLKFPSEPDTNATAKVIPHVWYPRESNERVDIAGLEIIGQNLQISGPVYFYENLEEDFREHEFGVYGVPRGYDEKGVWAYGKIRDVRFDGSVQLAILEGMTIKGGFSGSFVWDFKLDKIVGMVTTADPMNKLAFMLPIRRILGLWPEGEHKPKEKPENELKMSKFINRSTVLELILPKLEELKRGQRIEKFIFTINGVPGIGKTELLQKIKKEAEEKKINTILINFNRGIARQNDKFHLLQAIAERLFSENADWQNALHNYQAKKDDPAQIDFYQNRLLESFLENWSMRLRDTSLLLMIDDSQNISEFTKQMIEKILDSVYEYNRLLFIVAGRREFRLKNMRFRERMHTSTLDCLNESDTNELVANPEKNSKLSKKIFGLTRGYPLACKETNKWVRENQKTSSPDLSKLLETREGELIAKLAELLSENRILSHISDHNTRVRLGVLIKSVSPLRRLEENLLADLSQKSGVYPFKVDTLEARGDINNLINLTYLTKYDSSKREHSLELAIRRLLTLELKNKDKDYLLRIHDFVMDWYERKLNILAAQNIYTYEYGICLIEYIFHFTQIRHINDQQYKLEEEVKNIIGLWFGSKKLGISKDFREEFARDTEIEELLGETCYNNLIDFMADSDQISTII